METYRLDCTPLCQDGVTILRLAGFLNDQTVQAFEGITENLPAESPQVVLEASETRHISSIGFGAVLFLTAQLRERGGDLRIAGLSPALERVMRLAFADYFQTFPSVREAIESYHTVSAK